MMKYRIACVGRVKERYFADIIAGCMNEAAVSGRLEICEVPDESIPKNPGNSDIRSIVAAEGEKLSRFTDRNDYVIALCVDGKKTDTEELSRLIRKAENSGCGRVTFVIGGSLGLAPEIINRADYRMSISDMTFPHQLMRVVMAEQIAYLISGHHL